ncbi:MAG: TRIC cation channel family protein, partial [Rikenellaceae bacterium]
MGFTDIVEYLGTIAFAVSGIRLAARKKFDLFGAFVVGFITATGGGTVRDMLLQREVFWLSS